MTFSIRRSLNVSDSSSKPSGIAFYCRLSGYGKAPSLSASGKCCSSVDVSAFDAHDLIHDLGIAGDPLDVLGDVWAVLLIVLYGFGQVGTRLRRIDHQGHVEWIVGYVDRSSGIPSRIHHNQLRFDKSEKCR